MRGTILRVQVQRVPARTRPPKVLWWAGPEDLQPDLDLAWRAYIRRFDLEHPVRFCKQTLGWTTPQSRHLEQADRWTWLVLAGYTRLRLARVVVADARLPWERAGPPGRLLRVRVCRGFPLATPLDHCAELLGVDLATVCWRQEQGAGWTIRNRAEPRRRTVSTLACCERCSRSVSGW